MDLKLEERLKGMLEGRVKLQADVNAFNGAIEMLRELIVDRDKPEPEKKEA